MIKNYIWGFCMALADSVPGVSGGTIAFLMGFYDKFINSLNSLFKGGKKERKEGIIFLLKLGVGWVIGMSLAVTILSNLFDTKIYLISSLFIGFILMSIPIIIIEEKETIKGHYLDIIFAIIGIIAVVLLSTLKFGGNINLDHLNIGLIIYIFIAGMVAISAMVLPGISGSTILLTFGLYIPVITTIKELLHFNFDGFILVFILGLGVIAGVFVSIRGIKKLLISHRSKIMYGIIGMMVGSLYAIVQGPTTLKVPKDPMSIDTFSILFFFIGLGLVFILQKSKDLKIDKKKISV